MSLESATFIDDLDTANPTGSDNKSQGDDHLRLIKTVLKNSIKRVTRAFYVPGTVAKSANYTVLAADDNKTIVCDTTSAFTLTLPSLSASDAGWCVYVLKTTSDANPVWIAPPSGTINGHTKVRRSVANHIIKILWTGSVFVCSRTFGVPVGSLIPNYSTTLQQGCLWPDGTTFTAADYVELNTYLGGNTKPDVRERVLVPRDNSAGVTRITSGGSGIDGDTLGATGGTETHVLTEAQLASHTHVATPTDPGHYHFLAKSSSSGTGALSSSNQVSGAHDYGGSSPFNYTLIGHSSAADIGKSESKTTGITVSNASTGSGTAHQNMPPSIVVPHMLVAE